MLNYKLVLRQELKLKGDETTLVNLISEALTNGVARSTLIYEIHYYMDQNELHEKHLERLEDVVAAMEGWCSSVYILHPSNYEERL